MNIKLQLPPSKDDTKVIHVRVSTKHYSIVETLAKKHTVSISEIVRAILGEKFKNIK